MLFNQLDSHDVSRIINRAGSYDTFIQEMTILLTMPGTPCLYYGTEIALEGADDPYNRSLMPWKKIAQGKYTGITTEIKKLIDIRKLKEVASASALNWESTDSERLIHYSRGLEHKCHVYGDFYKLKILQKKERVSCVKLVSPQQINQKNL